MTSTEIRGIEQLGVRGGGNECIRLRSGREVNPVVHLSCCTGWQKVALELQGGGDAADWIAGRRIDRNALKKIAGAVDQIAVRVQLEVAAPCIAVNAAKERLISIEPGWSLHDEKAIAVDGHIRRRRRALDCTLDVIRGARICDHAPGDLARGH